MKSPWLVELPGIEPVAKGPVTCGNAELDYAKTTRNNAKTTCGYAEVLTASTRRSPADNPRQRSAAWQEAASEIELGTSPTARYQG